MGSFAELLQGTNLYRNLYHITIFATTTFQNQFFSTELLFVLLFTRGLTNKSFHNSYVKQQLLSTV